MLWLLGWGRDQEEEENERSRERRWREQHVFIDRMDQDHMAKRSDPVDRLMKQEHPG